MRNAFSPSMPVRTVIKLRPLAIGAMEERQIGFWNHLDFGLRELAQIHGLDAVDLQRELENLEVPAGDSEWESLPMYHLVDFLTEDHRIFLLSNLPDIRHLLDVHALSAPPAGDFYRATAREFEDFSRAFTIHLEEEENYLFPKILRNEACLKDRRVDPDFHGGSIHVFVALKALQGERSLVRHLESIRARVAGPAGADSPPAQERLLQLLDDFQSRLVRHAGLENGLLFPRASRNEKSLYNSYIQG